MSRARRMAEASAWARSPTTYPGVAASVATLDTSIGLG
jgi:hypothetical protein